MFHLMGLFSFLGGLRVLERFRLKNKKMFSFCCFFPTLHRTIFQMQQHSRTQKNPMIQTMATYMGLLRALYLPDRSLLRERLRCRSLLRLLFLSRLLLLFLPFFLSLSLLLLLFFLEPGLRLLLRLLLFLKLFTTTQHFAKHNCLFIKNLLF